MDGSRDQQLFCLDSPHMVSSFGTRYHQELQLLSVTPPLVLGPRTYGMANWSVNTCACNLTFEHKLMSSVVAQMRSSTTSVNELSPQAIVWPTAYPDELRQLYETLFLIARLLSWAFVVGYRPSSRNTLFPDCNFLFDLIIRQPWRDLYAFTCFVVPREFKSLTIRFFGFLKIGYQVST